MIKFNKYNVTNTETKVKSRVHYPLDNRVDNRKCVTIYAKDYDRSLGEVFASDYKNETDTMCDYFDKGSVALFENHPLYSAARAKAEETEYKLGTGHVYFFADKLGFLFNRYSDILNELAKRGFKYEDRWPYNLNIGEYPCGSYTPTPEALHINRQRIKERWPKNAHYYSKRIERGELV